MRFTGPWIINLGQKKLLTDTKQIELHKSTLGTNTRNGSRFHPDTISMPKEVNQGSAKVQPRFSQGSAKVQPGSVPRCQSTNENKARRRILLPIGRRSWTSCWLELCLYKPWTLRFFSHYFSSLVEDWCTIVGLSDLIKVCCVLLRSVFTLSFVRQTVMPKKFMNWSCWEMLSISMGRKRIRLLSISQTLTLTLWNSGLLSLELTVKV